MQAPRKLIDDAVMRFLTATLLALPLLSVTTAAYAALPLEAQRVALPTHLVDKKGKKTALLPKRRLEAGERIITGRNGRAGLLLEGSGILVLGDESELYIHSADTSGDGYGALVRMALMRGSLRLDTTPRPDLPPQDMRLNVGTLRVRVLGAEVWANVEPGLSQTVCLLQGTVDILSDVGNETLDNPGDCFRYGANNVRMRLRPDTDETLARKLARTAFAGETPPATPPVPIAAPQPESSVPPTPLQMPPPAPKPQAVAAVAPPPAPAAPIPAPIPAPPAITPVPVAVATPAPLPASAPPAAPEPPAPDAAPASAGTEWTVVVASLKRQAAAEQEAARLQAKGYAAQVAHMPNGFHRVYIGRFGSRKLAQSYAAQLRADEKLQTWIEPANQPPAAPVTPAVESAPAESAPVAASVSALAADPAPTPAPTAVAVEAPAAAVEAGEWTVIVASVKSGEAAAREAERLNRRGLPAQVCPAASGNYRVCVGRYETRELAREQSARLRETENLKGWVAKQID